MRLSCAAILCLGVIAQAAMAAAPSAPPAAPTAADRSVAAAPPKAVPRPAGAQPIGAKPAGAKPAGAKPAGTQPARPAPIVAAAAGLGTIETAVGDVRVRLRPGIPAQKATVGLRLGEGAVVRTGVTGRVFIRFGGSDLVRLSPNTELWLARLRAPKAGKAVTLLQLLVGRARVMLRRGAGPRDMDFALAAGTAVAAVKGTDFETDFPRPDGPVSVRVDNGTVMMVAVASWDIATLLQAVYDVARGAAGRPVTAGFATTVDPGAGGVAQPHPVPPRVSLELVSSAGRVIVITVSGSVEALPGDEIPAGAKVVVTGGAAVMAGAQAAIEAGAGAQFSYDVKVGAGGMQVTVTAGAASRSPIVVDDGTRTSTLLAGQSAVATGGVPEPVIAAQPMAKPKPVARPAAPARGGAPAMGGFSEDVMPDLPALASAAPALVAAYSGDAPPPPPDTSNQDVRTVSPSAPR